MDITYYQMVTFLLHGEHWIFRNGVLMNCCMVHCQLCLAYFMKQANDGKAGCFSSWKLYLLWKTEGKKKALLPKGRKFSCKISDFSIWCVVFAIIRMNMSFTKSVTGYFPNFVEVVMTDKLDSYSPPSKHTWKSIEAFLEPCTTCLLRNVNLNMIRHQYK